MKSSITAFIGIICQIPEKYYFYHMLSESWQVINGKLSYEDQKYSPAQITEFLIYTTPLYFFGIVCLMIALFVQKYRAKWFFFFMLLYSIMWLLSLSMGFLFGIALIVYLFSVRKEFFPPGPVPYFTHKNRV